MSRNKHMQHILILSAAFIFMMISGVYSSDNNDTWKNKWQVNAVWYQIFPDRFFNADRTNDPEETETYSNEGVLEKRAVYGWDDIPSSTAKYGGDLRGIIDRIDWLKDLGISGIWLNPIFKATSNHKYNTADYGAIDPAFGNREDLKELVTLAHSHNIKLILDGVFNHTGYEFWAFQDIVSKGEDSTYKNWYYVHNYPIVKLWEQTADNKPNYECWWGIGSLPKLNLDNEDTRAYIIDVSKGWMKLGIDGWRLDVPEEVKSETFWKEWSKAIKDANPNAYLTGEIWGKADKWLGKNGVFDGIMNYYGFREPVMLYFTGNKISLSEFDKMLAERRSLYSHEVNCALQNLLSSHDTARILSVIKNKDAEDSDKEKPNYDIGDPSREDIDKYKAILIFQMTYVGCPMIYYGDEIGMTGGKDPDCRRAMIWNEEKQNKDILEHCKKLISIRNSNQEFRTGDFETIVTDDKNNIYGYKRTENGASSSVFINYSPHKQKIAINCPKGEYKDLLSGQILRSGEKGLVLEFEPYGGKILQERQRGGAND